jgi:integrase
MEKRKKYAGITPHENGQWRLNVRIRVHGKIQAKKEIFTGTLERARGRAAELKKEIWKSCGSLKDTTTLSTFKDVAGVYMSGRQFSPSHVAKINTIISDLGSIPLNVFPDRFKQYLLLRRREPSKTTGRQRSNADNNRRVEIVRAAFSVAVSQELLEKNPITKAKFPRLKEIPRDVSISELDRQRLLNVIDGEASHLSAVVRFALQVPCRRSELINMRREDLDMFNNCIRVRNGTTKNDAGTWKPIPPGMKDYFRNIPAGCPWLFYRQDADGTFHPLGDFKRAWKRCRRLAGLPDLRVHDTRHFSATELVNNGTPEQVVMQVAGWKTNMLKNYYNRNPQKALELVQFSRNCEPLCEPFVSSAM